MLNKSGLQVAKAHENNRESGTASCGQRRNNATGRSPRHHINRKADYVDKSLLVVVLATIDATRRTIRSLVRRESHQ